MYFRFYLALQQSDKNLNGKSSEKRGKSRNQRSQRKTQLPTSISTYKTFEKKVTKERKKKKLKDNLKFLTHSKKLTYIRPLKGVDTTTYKVRCIFIFYWN